jgi:hypothetical protein
MTKKKLEPVSEELVNKIINEGATPASYGCGSGSGSGCGSGCGCGSGSGSGENTGTSGQITVSTNFSYDFCPFTVSATVDYRAYLKKVGKDDPRQEIEYEYVKVTFTFGGGTNILYDKDGNKLEYKASVNKDKVENYTPWNNPKIITAHTTGSISTPKNIYNNVDISATVYFDLRISSGTLEVDHCHIQGNVTI